MRLSSGAVLISAHVRGFHQTRAEEAEVSLRVLPSSVPLGLHVEPPLTESVIWKYLKKVFHTSLDVVRILKRALYLALCFSPAVTCSPLLLMQTPELTHWWWETVRRGIWAAGPCLTKFAQWAATRPDIFPLHLCDQLAHLQCSTKRHAWGDSERVLERAFGPRWRKVLRLDSYSSVGSGLVAQVYRGTLTPAECKSKSSRDDLMVAVKVLHPDVRQALEDDLAMMQLLVRWLESAAFWGERMLVGAGAGAEDGQGALASVFSLSESVDEFRELMTAQLDLQREGVALTRFRRNFSAPKWAERVIFPAPIDMHQVMHIEAGGRDKSHEQVSSDVLVETFQTGVPMTELLAQKTLQDEMQQKEGHREEQGGRGTLALSTREEKEVAALGMDVVLKMIFEDNFIHGDLHPGNMLLTRRPEDPEKFQLVLLDTGIYSELTREDRRNFLALFKAVIDDDGGAAARMMIEESREFVLPNGQKTKLRPVEQEKFEAKMHHLVHEARTRGLLLGREGVSGLLHSVLSLCYEHRVKLEPHFVSVVLSVAIIEGLGRRLDPDIDLLARAAPFIAKAAAKAALTRGEL